MNVETASSFRVIGRVVHRRIGPENLLVPVSGPAANACCVFPLNESGLFLWDKLSNGATTGAAAAALMEKFGLTLDQAVADTRAFVDELVKQELVEPAS